MKPVVFSRSAVADLVAIADGFWNQRLGIATATDLERRCRSLGIFPRSGHVFTPWPVFRRLIHGRYLIFYRDLRDEVRIERIVHGARDVLSVLFEEPE